MDLSAPDQLKTTPPLEIADGKGIAASDWHLGLIGSQGVQAAASVRIRISRHKPTLIVLNGDMIEAKEITGSPAAVEAKLDKAVGVIRDLIEHALSKNPDCRVVYVIGNHDNRHEVYDRLAVLEQEFPDNFRVIDDATRVRDAVFTHGDLFMKPKRVEHSDQRTAGHGVLRNVETLREALFGEPIEMEPVASRGRDDKHAHGAFRPMRPYTGLKGVAINAQSVAIGAIDQHISHKVYPLDQVTEATLTGLKNSGLEHEGKPICDGAKTVCMGHIHPKYGTTHRTRDGTLFRFTGPATLGSKNTMYTFDIGDGRCHNFEAFTHERGAAVGM